MIDYSICPETEDHKHVPIVGINEYDRRYEHGGYFTIECMMCGTTTSFPFPDEDTIEWN